MLLLAATGRDQQPIAQQPKACQPRAQRHRSGGGEPIKQESHNAAPHRCPEWPRGDRAGAGLGPGQVVALLVNGRGGVTCVQWKEEKILSIYNQRLDLFRRSADYMSFGSQFKAEDFFEVKKCFRLFGWPPICQGHYCLPDQCDISLPSTLLVTL